MERTCLVQRLLPPYEGTDVFGDNPFVNTGGIRNWGLSDEGKKLLGRCFRFDYMGAAEFEFGAIPEALKKVASHAQEGALIGLKLNIALKDVERTWFDESNEPPKGEERVYVICREDDAEEVERRIRAWAAHDHDRYGRQNDDPQWWLKEATRLNASLRPNPSWPSEICGWFEMDNGFFFFTNEEMYDNVRMLFGVDAKEQHAQDHNS